ncbi:hypothetical protein R3I94_019452 [Phoxinus phoxinus]
MDCKQRNVSEQQDFIWVNALEYQHPAWPLILLLADVMSNFLSAFSPRRLLTCPSGDTCLSVTWHTYTQNHSKVLDLSMAHNLN